MLAVGLGVLLMVILRAAVRSGIALLAAALLTTYVALPGAVGTLIWVLAGGFTALNVVSVVVTIGALLSGTGRVKRL